MRLDIKIEGMSNEETYHSDYISFGFYRRVVATAWHPELGKIYEKPYLDWNYRKYTEEDIKKWDEVGNDDLDIFLTHSDCSGKLTWKECQKIYKPMKKLENKMKSVKLMNTYVDFYDTHMLWLKMLKFCLENKVSMYFC